MYKCSWMPPYPGQWPAPMAFRPDPSPWPLACSNLGWKSIVHPERAKMHKYPNKHEEKSLENANVRATQISFPPPIFDEWITITEEWMSCGTLFTQIRSLLMLKLPSDQVSHVSITTPCDIIPDLWLVNLPSYSPLIGPDSRVVWVTVSISRIVISCHSALLSGKPLYCITSPPLFRFLKYFRLYKKPKNLWCLLATVGLVPHFAQNYKMYFISDVAPLCQSHCRPHGAQIVARGSRGRPGPGQGWWGRTWSLWVMMTVRGWGPSSTWAVVTRASRSLSVILCSPPASTSWTITEKVRISNDGNIGWSVDELSLSLI